MGLFSSSKSSSSTSITDSRTVADNAGQAVNATGSGTSNLTITDGGAFDLVGELLDTVETISNNATRGAFELASTSTDKTLTGLQEQAKQAVSAVQESSRSELNQNTQLLIKWGGIAVVGFFAFKIVGQLS